MFKFIKNDFTRCVATFVGGSLGVGIFSIPFVFAENGVIFSSALFIFLAIMVLIVHLMSVDVSEITPGKLRLVGQTGHYFGKKGKYFMGISVLAGCIITLVVYILVAGTFLYLLFEHIGLDLDVVFWRTIFWFIMGAGIILGLHKMTRVEVLLGGLFAAMLAIFLVQGIPHIQYDNLMTFSFNNFFLSWSVILFALFHLSSIAESHAVVRKPRKYREAVILGTIIVAVISIAFALVVVGITKGETSTEAVESIAAIGQLGSGLFVVGALIGLLAITTSFLVSGLNMRDIMRYDFGIKKKTSVAIVVFVTLPFLLLGVEDILTLLVIAGIIVGAIKGCCVIVLHILIQTKYPRSTRGLTKLPVFVHGVMFCMFIIGGIYSVFGLLLQ